MAQKFKLNNILCTERRKRWSVAAIWLATIYSTLYIVRPICEYLKANTSFNALITISLSIVLILILMNALKRIKVQSKSTKFYISLTIGLYFTLFYWLKIPEEKIHLVQYGFLAFMIYYALSLDCRDKTAYLSAFVMASLLGWADEGIQHILPNRFYDTKDVILNMISGGMGLLLTWSLRRDGKTIRKAQ